MIFQRKNQCAHCAHYTGSECCTAFPEGIPKPLLSGEVLHRDPYPGDNGISFRLKLDALEVPAEFLPPKQQAEG